MPSNDVLSPFGVHPCCAWSPSRGRFISVWQWDDAVFTDFTNGPLIDLYGSEGAFPRIHTTPDGETWLSWRMGAAPYDGFRALLRDDNKLASPVNLGPIHGAFPAVFGREWFAYQYNGSAAGYPVQRVSLLSGATSTVRHGAPTGLGLIDSVGTVFTWDELRGLIPGLHDPTSAGGLVVGATDRSGQPCVVVTHRATGEELVLWFGEDSQNPFIAWDGGELFAVVAWSAAGQGVRRAQFWRSELKPAEVPPPPRRDPVVARPSSPRAMSWFFDHGRYGEYWPACHGTICGTSLYADGSGVYPADTVARMRAVAERSGGCYLDSRDIERAKSWWKQVIAVFLHEVGDVGWEASTARATMRRLGLPVRPVIAVVSPNDALNVSYAGKCDAVAAEIYFDAPASSWDFMRQIARDRVDAVLARQSPLPVYLVAQSYDRSDGPGPLVGPWESPNGRDQLTAIAQACFDSLSGSRVLGLFPFAYARPGGATTYPELDRWYSAQALALTRPPLPKDEDDDMNDNYTPVPTPDPELTELANRLDKKYSAPPDQGGLGRGPTTTFVDPLGHSRWRRDYFYNRDKGMTPDQAWAAVNRGINQVVGFPGDIDPNRPQ